MLARICCGRRGDRAAGRRCRPSAAFRRRRIGHDDIDRGVERADIDKPGWCAAGRRPRARTRCPSPARSDSRARTARSCVSLRGVELARRQRSRLRSSLLLGVEPGLAPVGQACRQIRGGPAVTANVGIGLEARLDIAVHERRPVGRRLGASAWFAVACGLGAPAAAGERCDGHRRQHPSRERVMLLSCRTARPDAQR